MEKKKAAKLQVCHMIPFTVTPVMIVTLCNMTYDASMFPSVHNNNTNTVTESESSVSSSNHDLVLEKRELLSMEVFHR